MGRAHGGSLQKTAPRTLHGVPGVTTRWHSPAMHPAGWAQGIHALLRAVPAGWRVSCRHLSALLPRTGPRLADPRPPRNLPTLRAPNPSPAEETHVQKGEPNIQA